MQSIVLDTNVLVMSISARNVYHKVWQAFLQGDYTLCVSNEILEEYVEVLTRNINARVAEAVVYAILTRWNVRKLDPHYRFHLIKADEDDNKFVDCAIVAVADYIVSEDAHFRVLEEIPFPKVYVIRLQWFVEELAKL